VVKLTDIVESIYNLSPGEIPKMKNFLKRGTIDQMNLMQPYDDRSTNYSKMKGSIEQEGFSVDHPENKETVVGWTWNQDDTIDGDDKVDQAILSRELQTLQDVKKLIVRLLDAGYTISAIETFINGYIRGN